jgi:hypothetical protein
MDTIRPCDGSPSQKIIAKAYCGGKQFLPGTGTVCCGGQEILPDPGEVCCGDTLVDADKCRRCLFSDPGEVIMLVEDATEVLQQTSAPIISTVRERGRKEKQNKLALK